jgi:hypothetical protein
MRALGRGEGSPLPSHAYWQKTNAALSGVDIEEEILRSVSKPTQPWGTDYLCHGVVDYKNRLYFIDRHSIFYVDNEHPNGCVVTEAEGES